MKMPAKTKAKWLKALRSGDYQQAQNTLFDGKGYCCLGVLQQVCDGKVESRELTEDIPAVMPSIAWYEAHNVVDAFGEYGDSYTYEGWLALMNDGSSSATPRKSFADIADWIEKNVEGIES